MSCFRCGRWIAVVARLLVVYSVASTAAAVGAKEFASHAPLRPLPQASQRPLAAGPTKFVDPARGDDAHDGSEAKPWRTLVHGAAHLQPGDTLVLRGGTYYEHLRATLVGTVEQPITIRAYPGELVTLDGGLPEFQLDAANAWEPYADGAAGEFRSTRTYPDFEVKTGDLKVHLLGGFVDSLLPLQGYWSHGDLQSDNPYWTLNDGTKGGKSGNEKHVYCGPGLWYDPETDRIHCRLAHTQLPQLGDGNYRGETDPRKLPLIVATDPAGPVVVLKECRHVRLQDLVLRGAREETLLLDGGEQIELDGLSLYGGASCLRAPSTYNLRVANTAFRGLAAPWTFRGSLKYRSIESRLVRTTGWDPTGRDGRMYEFAYCEFTDSVDGVFVGNIFTVYFHHNLVENVSDDAIFVTSGTGFDGETPGGNGNYYQNRFARNLTCFAFGVGHGRQKTLIDDKKGTPGKKQLGHGMVIRRNVFDFRAPVMYHWPSGPDDGRELTSLGRMFGDHGSPAWEMMHIFHNTILAGDPPRYEYGTDGFTRAMAHGTFRDIKNNIVCQLHGLPGQTFPPGDVQYAADHNLLWSVDEGPLTTALPKPKYPRDQVPPQAAWGEGDKFADPKFVRYEADWRKPVDLRLQPGSPAIDAGYTFKHTTDALGKQDAGLPDLGAIPLGIEPWRVGCFGRMDVCGNEIPAAERTPIAVEWRAQEKMVQPLKPWHDGKPAAVVTGYPAFEAPLVRFALAKQAVRTDFFDKQWLDPREYEKYSLVVVDGSFTRGRIVPDHFAESEILVVKKFLEDGGTLWLFRERLDLFAEPAGLKFLNDTFGTQLKLNTRPIAIRKPEHPWIAHLAKAGADATWIEKASAGVTFSNAGSEVVIGSDLGKTVLGRIPVGKGQVIFSGFSPGSAVPNGREKSTVADERRFSDLMQIVTNIVGELYRTKGE
jgi:hypothetical protein